MKVLNPLAINLHIRIGMEFGIEGRPNSVAEHVRLNDELVRVKSSKEGDR